MTPVVGRDTLVPMNTSRLTLPSLAFVLVGLLLIARVASAVGSGSSIPGDTGAPSTIGQWLLPLVIEWGSTLAEVALGAAVVWLSRRVGKLGLSAEATTLIQRKIAEGHLAVERGRAELRDELLKAASDGVIDSEERKRLGDMVHGVVRSVSVAEAETIRRALGLASAEDVDTLLGRHAETVIGVRHSAHLAGRAATSSESIAGESGRPAIAGIPGDTAPGSERLPRRPIAAP